MGNGNKKILAVGGVSVVLAGWFGASMYAGSVAERDALDLAGTFAEAKSRAVERFEAAYLDALLRRCGGNLSKASRQADIARNHLRSLLKKRGLYDPGDT